MKQQSPVSLRFYILFTVFTWFGTSLIFAQTKHTVSGYITTLSSGEALSSAKVYVPALNK
jgi:hypothetical protein